MDEGTNLSLIRDLMDSFLEENKFRRKGNFWFLRRGKFTVSIDIQKSQWSESIYINVGISLETEKKIRKPHEGHIRFRIVDSDSGSGEFNADMDISAIKKLVFDQVIEHFCSKDSTEELAGLINANPSRYIITMDGKEILDEKDKK